MVKPWHDAHGAAVASRPRRAAKAIIPLGQNDQPVQLGREDQPAPVGSRARVLLILASLALFAISWLPLPPAPGLRSTMMNLLPGFAAALCLGRLNWHRLILFTVVLGQVVLTLVSLPAAWLGWWRPGLLWLIVLVPTVLFLVIVLVREMAWLDFRFSPPAARTVLLSPTVLALLGGTLAVVTAAATGGAPQPAGMALTAGPLWFVGAAAVVAAVGWSLISRQRQAGVAVLVLAGLVATSQAAMYGQPTVTVAARHLGLVETILSAGRLQPAIDIYQAWAGLFSGTALVIGQTRVDPFSYAAVWGAAASVVMALGVRTLAGNFVSPARSWGAALVFALASTLTTSFFAPQVSGFAMSLAVLALLTGRYVGVSVWGGQVVAVAIVTAIAVTHQISPYLLGLALTAMAIFRVIRPWWIPILAFGPAVIWAAVNRGILERYVSIDVVGQFSTNIAPPERSVAPLGASTAYLMTFGLPILLLVVIGVAAIGSWICYRNRLATTLVATAASPALLAVATDYGQEGIFRVTLFALPWLAILVAALPWQRLSGRLAVVIGVVVLPVLFATHVVGLTGMDWVRVIRPDDRAAAAYFEQNSADGAVAFAVGTGVATPAYSTDRQTGFFYRGREDVLDKTTAYLDAGGPDYDPVADVERLTDALLTEGHTDLWVVTGPTTGAYGQRYGLQSVEDYDALREAWRSSPRWELEYESGDAQVYRLRSTGQ